MAISRHTEVAGYYGYTSRCLSVHTSFLDNSSYSFHRITLKLGGQLNHEAVQRIFFRSYSSPNFDSVFTFFNHFSDLTLFPDNSSYSFHPIGLKHGGKLGYEVMQSILF